MKKLKLLLVPLLILCITACGKSPEEVLEEAFTNLENAKSYTMKMEMKIGVAASGISIELPVNFDMYYDNVNKLAKGEMSTSIMGTETSVQMYMDMTNENEVITYTSEEDLTEGDIIWTKSTEETSTITDTTAQLDYSKAKKEKDEDGKTYYSISLPKDELASLMGDTMEDMGSLKADPVFHIYVEDGTVTKLYTDLKDVIDLGDMEGIEVNITAASMEINITDINNTTVTEIPSEVINNAIDAEVLEVQSYAEDYIFEIEWNAEYGTTTTFTDTTLEYDGPAPESVNVKVVDGYVESGTIKINGYTMTITEGIVGTPTK